MDEDLATWWPERRGIKVGRAHEVLPDRDCRLCSCLVEEVDCQFCLWEQEITLVGREGCVNAAKYHNEIGLEHSDGLFGAGIAVVYVGWDQLVGAVLLVSDVAAVVSAGIIV